MGQLSVLDAEEVPGNQLLTSLLERSFPAQRISTDIKSAPELTQRLAECRSNEGESVQGETAPGSCAHAIDTGYKGNWAFDELNLDTSIWQTLKGYESHCTQRNYEGYSGR